MLDLTELDLWVSQQLAPIREELNSQGVPVAMLPKEAASYSRDSRSGLISIAIPQVSGVDPGDRGIGQSLVYEIAVLLRMPERYRDTAEEKQALESVADAVAISLVQKYPLGDEDIITPIWLFNYELLQPEGSQWIATLMFRFKRSTTAKFENYYEKAGELVRLSVELLRKEEQELVLEEEWHTKGELTNGKLSNH